MFCRRYVAAPVQHSLRSSVMEVAPGQLGERCAAHSLSMTDIITSSYHLPSCQTASRRRPSSTNPAFS